VEVGLLLIFQNYQGRGSDADMMRDQMRLALLAEELGYDKVWPPEHHFTDYSACPDNIAFLVWLAGGTQRIALAIGAVIVPWNDPLRVAERIVMLDHLSSGRAVLGLGRGLARVEYQSFGIEMGESRARFDEAARMILAAVETGFIEGNGPYYPQRRTEIRPRPLRSFRDRHASEPPPPLTGDLFFCDTDSGRAEEMAMEHMANYFLTIVHHYELLSDHFRALPGYQMYASASDAFKTVGLEVAVRSYCGVQTWGTPAQILEKLRWRRELLGNFELNLISHYGGMPVENAERSMRLFAGTVLPEIRCW